ncbi:hypothetical protein ACFSQD_14985 [Flavihumibacter stibioxidans]|uniref:Lipoprotein n=1 Tax=Flavihumibacter stibioxidans TaxID=1834163 RepID=A0ABR7M8Y2_9BACT|nr:hypothetical protein [Flavihumibacter stibioxidans]MBC6491091.1 hypothetical protein [Flavihumibacter stibioxidans]
MKILQAGKRMVIFSMVVLSATACQYIAGNKAKTASPANSQKTCLQDSSCPEGRHPDNHPGKAGAHESIIWESLSGNILSIVL